MMNQGIYDNHASEFQKVLTEMLAGLDGECLDSSSHVEEWDNEGVKAWAIFELKHNDTLYHFRLDDAGRGYCEASKLSGEWWRITAPTTFEDCAKIFKMYLEE